jgi:phosphate transport system substrate-binding protein
MINFNNEYGNIINFILEKCQPSTKDYVVYKFIRSLNEYTIKDFESKESQAFLSRIKVLDLTSSDNPVYPDDYFKPYQAYIALSQYPLIREVYMINREGRAGLGTGFVSYVAGDAGQRIVRIAGLLPATMPVRIIKTE